MNRTLTPDDYGAIQSFLEGRAGIRLGDGKEYLVVSRLARLLQRFEIAGVQQPDSWDERARDLRVEALYPSGP